jgi:hypothetical protein
LSLTLKAFANFSPGLRFGTWEDAPHLQKTQTLKGLRRDNRRPVATPSELRQNKHASCAQGFKANLGLELANAFGVKLKLHQYRSFGLLAS